MASRPQKELAEDPTLAEALGTVPPDRPVLKERNALRAERNPAPALPSRAEEKEEPL